MACGIYRKLSEDYGDEKLTAAEYLTLSEEHFGAGGPHFCKNCEYSDESISGPHCSQCLFATPKGCRFTPKEEA